MATAGEVVDEDLGRMNPPFGRGRTETQRPSVVARDNVGALQPGESFTAMGFYRHPDRMQILDIAKPHSRSPNKGLAAKCLAFEFRYRELLGWCVNRYGWYSINVL